MVYFFITLRLYVNLMWKSSSQISNQEIPTDKYNIEIAAMAAHIIFRPCHWWCTYCLFVNYCSWYLFCADGSWCICVTRIHDSNEEKQKDSSATVMKCLMMKYYSSIESNITCWTIRASQINLPRMKVCGSITCKGYPRYCSVAASC